MKEAETRLTMATHYGNPYPRFHFHSCKFYFHLATFFRPVNIPKFSFSKREGKKVGLFLRVLSCIIMDAHYINKDMFELLPHTAFHWVLACKSPSWGTTDDARLVRVKFTPRILIHMHFTLSKQPPHPVLKILPF